MHILLSFLGIGKYEPCRYQIGTSQSAPETFFIAALADHLRPQKVLSLQTAEAAKTHGDALSERFDTLGLNHEAYFIPAGKSEQELWKIFDALTTHVPRECTLHLDITHGFRSLALLSLIALSYLRVTRNVTIGGIHYGAWEARSGTGEAQVAPTFDLTPFLTLLDWSTAADQLLNTGSAERVAQLLQNTQQSVWQNRGDAPAEDLPKIMSSLGSSLRAAANNLTLLRTAHFAESTASLVRQLTRIEETSELQTHARPFLELLKPVRDDLTRFSDSDLSTLRDLIGWLVEKDRPDAALTLASEWLVNWIMVTLEEPDHHSTDETRQPFSECLNLLIDRSSKLPAIKNPSPESQQHFDELKRLISPDQIALLTRLASRIKDARNDLNHAAFRTTPRKASDIIKLAREISEEIRQLTLPCQE